MNSKTTEQAADASELALEYAAKNGLDSKGVIAYAKAYAKGKREGLEYNAEQINNLKIKVNAGIDTITTLQAEVDRLRALVPVWVTCQGTDDIPEGKWLVKLETEVTGNTIFPMIKDKQFSIIGTQFAWDMPLVIAYMPPPAPSINQEK